MKFKKTIIFIVITAIAVSAAAYFSIGAKEEVEYTVAKIELGSINQTVSETGNVKASSEINLNFLNTGNISKILVKTGGYAEKGQILAELDYSGLSIKQQEAQANLDVAKANLSKLLAGATREEIVVSQAGVDQAKSSYDSAVRELEKTKKTAAESIAQAEKTLSDLELDSGGNVTAYEQAVAAAQTTLDNTKITYQRSIDNNKDIVLTTLENKLTAAKTALDDINTILNDEDALDVLSVKKTSYLEDTKTGYKQASDLLDAANISLDAAEQSKNSAGISQATEDALSALNKTYTALSACYNALESTITSSDFTQTDLDAYKTSINTELTNINTAISSVQTAWQNLDDAILAYNTNVSNSEKSLAQKQASLDDAIISAGNSLNTAKLAGDQQITAAESKVENSREAWEVAKANLAKIKAPADLQDAALSRAQVKQAQAALDSVANQIENSIIKAPISGTITQVEYEIGEQAMAGKPVISMLGDNNFEIEVDISEADISKVRINNPAEITLDAFGEDIKFAGKVYFIEPAETVIQDVIYYKVVVEFTSPPAPLLIRRGEQEQSESGERFNIKSGMTANVIITTAEKDNILIIPNRAIVEKNGLGKIVRVLRNGQIQEASVQIGLRGDEGMVEALFFGKAQDGSEVKAGDEVVTFIKEK